MGRAMPEDRLRRDLRCDIRDKGDEALMTPAERQKLYRRRQRGSLSVVPVEVDFDTIDDLIEAGLLPAADSEHAQAVGRAVRRVVDAWKETVTRHASCRA